MRGRSENPTAAPAPLAPPETSARINRTAAYSREGKEWFFKTSCLSKKTAAERPLSKIRLIVSYYRAYRGSLSNLSFRAVRLRPEECVKAGPGKGLALLLQATVFLQQLQPKGGDTG